MIRSPIVGACPPAWRRHVAPALLALAGLAAAQGLAQAAPVVAPGSNYAFSVRGQGNGVGSGTTQVDAVTFDGQPETFTRTSAATGATSRFTLDEGQSDLGGGRWEIRVGLVAEGELFDVPGEIGFFRLGGPDHKPLDLLQPVRLLSALMTVTRGAEPPAVLDLVNLFPGDFSSLEPWDGYLMSNERFIGLFGLGGTGVRRVDFAFDVSDQPVPAPATLALATMGLLGLGCGRRRG